MTCNGFMRTWSMMNIIVAGVILIISLINACPQCDWCENHLWILVGFDGLLSSTLTWLFFNSFQKPSDQVKKWKRDDWMEFLVFQLALVFCLAFPFVVIMLNTCEQKTAAQAFFYYMIPKQSLEFVGFWTFAWAHYRYQPPLLQDQIEDSL